MSNATCIQGCNVTSFTELPDNKLLIDAGALLLVKNWSEITHQLEPYRKLHHDRVFPNFDADKFPYVIEYGKESFNIRNLKTDRVDTLI